MIEPTDKIGRITLYNADCMEVMKQYPDKYFDLAIVDPPYGIERFKKCKQNDDINTKDVFANKFLNNEAFNNTKPTKKYWNELFRISKNQIVFGANNFEMPPSEYFLIWDKKQSMPNFARCEYAWVSMGLKTPAKVFDYSIQKHNHTDKIHPTQKPVKLYEWILQNYAKEGEKILDTHFGSLSIGIACEKLGFELTAIELDKDYYRMAKQRLLNFKKQLTIEF